MSDPIEINAVNTEYLDNLRGLGELEISELQTVMTYTGNELANFDVARIIPVYTFVFGEPPWSEGAINIVTDEVVSLSEYLELGAVDAEKYRLFYNPDELTGRFQTEFSSEGQIPFLVTLEQTDTPTGMTWGVMSDTGTILNRIRNANYSSSDKLIKQWDDLVAQPLFSNLDTIFGSLSSIVYVDEILLIPQARGMKSSALFEALFRQILELQNQNSEPDQSLNVFFRTSISSDSAMGTIARSLFVGTGMFQEVIIEGDSENIAYFVGRIPPEILEILNNSDNLFREFVRLSKHS